MILVTVTALLPVTACGGVGFADDSDTFTTMGFGLGDALANTRIDLASETLDGVALQVNEGAFDEQQFLSAVAADDPPDVVRMDRSLIGGYAARGALVPLTDCLADRDVDLGQYRDEAVAEATLDGAVYGLPDSYDSRVTLVNGAVLDEVGLRTADVDTSDWDRLAQASEEMQRQEDGQLTRIGFDPKIPEFFPLWVQANGGALISDDGRTALLDSPEVVEALEYTLGLIDAQGGWGTFESLRDTFDQFGAANPIASGQAGAYPMEDWYVNVLAGTSPDVDLRAEPFRDRQGEPLNYSSGTSWVIPQGSPHPEEACEFVTTMTATDTWVTAAEAKAEEVRATGAPYVGDFTGNREADRIIEQEIWEPTGNAAFDDATALLYDIQDDAFSVPANAAGTEFRKAWQSAVNRALSGDSSPEDALARAQDEAQSALDRAASQRGER